MRKVKVAIGTNDGINIASTHAGDSNIFVVYEIAENVHPVIIDKRSNIAEKNNDESENIGENHGDSGKMKLILKLINDCDIIVSRKISPNFRKMDENTNFQPVIVAVDNLEEIAALVLQNFNLLHNLVIKRKQGMRKLGVPVLSSTSMD